MSFEGYYQLVCDNGHYSTVDCYDHEQAEVCECGALYVWENLVDVTNGSWEDGKRIDGYVELEVISKHECKCQACGNVHYSELPQYKIPNKQVKKSNPHYEERNV